MQLLSGIVVVAFGLFLIGLAAAVVLTPAPAERFLRSFASSARAHYTEQVLRLVAGAGLVGLAGAMAWPIVFRVFGWVLVVTAAGLLLMPWRWHQRFAAKVMPPLFRHLRLFALGAFGLGIAILYGVFPR